MYKADPIMETPIPGVSLAKFLDVNFAEITLPTVLVAIGTERRVVVYQDIDEVTVDLLALFVFENVFIDLAVNKKSEKDIKSEKHTSGYSDEL